MSAVLRLWRSLVGLEAEPGHRAVILHQSDIILQRMASHTDDSHPNELNVSEAELLEALCVCAGSDPENCSYSRGYVKRQAVFACNTCTPNAAEPAGVCLACVNKCHDGHEIFELYTKRNFRCDCGNGKFGDFKCQLNADKSDKNPRNLYNHNFSGCYCTCDSLYTDDQGGDEMIQCVICEDWFHSQHLGCNVEEPEELQEMTCEGCMNKAPFLWEYAARFAVPPPVINTSHPEEKEEAGVEGGEPEPSQSRAEGVSTSENHREPKAIGKSPSKRNLDEMTDNPNNTLECKLKELQSHALQKPRLGAVFWPYSWRSELCTCTACKRAYVAAEVQFLLDQSDTMLAYEQKSFSEPFGQHPLMALTSSMNHIQQLEVIYGFNELTTSIDVFFERCAAEGKTITVEAVNEFFEELRDRKRRRTNAGYQ
ncbi:putative E3 ubiquitin-protein ligase UBR7 [Gouania willdenowi]|uniref:UBR-type domain-containing protein n=1 Tax=Gouania willdenowi TaxID=441366 RepID=A0A8C5E402_GOUWI|nr:putative E3 ubiquitin-protein ligase UBR7 [Gouania willdenowi]